MLYYLSSILDEALQAEDGSIAFPATCDNSFILRFACISVFISFCMGDLLQTVGMFRYICLIRTADKFEEVRVKTKTKKLHSVLFESESDA